MEQAQFRYVSALLLVICIIIAPTTSRQSSVSASHADNNERRIVCYYTNWSVYRPGTAKFTPQNINPYLCTHLIYAFGGFTKENTLKPFDKYQDIEQGGYAKFTGLKTYNKKLKCLLAIGGWNEASGRFSPLVANVEKRTTFIRNVIKFLRQNHFDGLDLDWEYPAFRDGGKPADRKNYAQFVQELAEEFKRESSKTGRPRLLLTMAVPAGIEYVEKGYDIPKLNQYLDWFNLLTYDYHSAFEPSVNHHAPLYSLVEGDEYNYDTELNIDYTVKHYINAGADRQKLVLGIPTYGRSFTLFNEEANELGSPTDGPGEQGDATREKGYLAYYEICQRVKEEDWTVVSPNDKAMGPYAYKDNQWVGYDDEEIARKKSMYVLENDLGGIMFWSIDNDDFRGNCNGKPFPIIEAAKETLLQDFSSGNYLDSKPIATKKPTAAPVAPPVSKPTSASTRRKTRPRRPISKSTTTTTARYEEEYARPSSTSTTTTPAPPTTPDTGSDFKCEDEGFFPHPRDCKKYFWCLDSGPSELGIVAHQFTCPSGLYFNKLADSCDYTRNVQCSKSKATTTTTSKTTTTTTRGTPSTTTRAPRTTVVTAVPPKRNYASIRPILRTTTPTTTTTTTTTTTEAYEEYAEEDEEYEEEDGDGVGSGGAQAGYDAEDPKVIKELIDLIKKVGGIEELEKQLKQNQDGSHVLLDPNQSTLTTTPPPSIHQKLYEKILRKPIPGVKQAANVDSPTTPATSSSGSASNQLPKYSSIYRATSNSRPGPQNAGLDQFADTEGLRNDKPQYITITRNRPQTSSLPATEDAALANENEEEEEDGAASIEDISIARSTEPTFVRYTIPEHVEVTGHDETYRLSSFDGQSQQSSSTPYVTIYRTTTPKGGAGAGGESAADKPSVYQTINRGQSNHGIKPHQHHNHQQEQSQQPGYNVEEDVDEEDEADDVEQDTLKNVAVSNSAVSTVSPNQHHRSHQSTITTTNIDDGRKSLSSSSSSTATSNTLARSPTTTPRYTSLNRHRIRPSDETTNNGGGSTLTTIGGMGSGSNGDKDWHSSISFDTENVLNGLQFQTNSQADQIHIRVTATTETIHEDNDDYYSSDPDHKSSLPNVIINGKPTRLEEIPVGGAEGEMGGVRLAEEMAQPPGEAGSGTMPPRSNTMATITNPIKLIITTSGALGHHHHNHHHNQQQEQQQHRYQSMETLTNMYPDTAPGYDHDMRVEDIISGQDEADADTYDLNDGLDLASLLAHHEEASLENDIGISNNDTLNSAPQLLPPPSSPSLLEPDEPLLAEIMSDSIGGMNAEEGANVVVGGYSVEVGGGGGRGGGGVDIVEDDPVKERPHSHQATTTTVTTSAPPPPSSSVSPIGSGGYRKRIRVPAMPPKRTTTESPPAVPHDNEINNQVKLLRTRPSYRPTSASTTSAPNTTPATQSTVPFFRKRTRPAILTRSTTTASPTTASTPATTTTTTKPRLVVRRKLFRTSSTTVSPLEVDRIKSESTISLNSINDQELGSSITQENKFLNNRFNQIGESEVDGDFVGAAIQAISKAPLPVQPLSTTNKYKHQSQYRGGLHALSATSTSTASSIAADVNSFKESTTSFPANHKRLKIKKISTRLRTQNVPEFVTTISSAATTTTERQFNKPILIMTNDRPHSRRERPKPFEKITTPKSAVLGIEDSSLRYSSGLEYPATETTSSSSSTGVSDRPQFDYDYYDENDDQFIGKIRAQVKVILHGNGHIECLDQGNFPHPLQCKKFISCAKMETGRLGELVGWEYTCPRGLSYDPVGGICNWAAGLGCKEN